MLDDATKAQVRLYLGYSGRYWNVITRLEQAMDALTSDMENLVRDLIDSLNDIDAKLLDAHGRLKALRAEDVDLPAGMEISMLRSEGRRFVARLGAVLGVRPRHNPFSTGTADIGTIEDVYGPMGGDYNTGGNSGKWG